MNSAKKLRWYDSIFKQLNNINIYPIIYGCTTVQNIYENMFTSLSSCFVQKKQQNILKKFRKYYHSDNSNSLIPSHLNTNLPMYNIL